jgi:hypothetical protein
MPSQDADIRSFDDLANEEHTVTAKWDHQGVCVHTRLCGGVRLAADFANCILTKDGWALAVHVQDLQPVSTYGGLHSS